ncbi:hypothetical protein KXS07_36510 [Inquilinus limosus]|uniref:hypothetical protein n=1 Tax=Inquilinus limosus TaxID=171674 RepID=UPI003F17B101
MVDSLLGGVLNAIGQILGGDAGDPSDSVSHGREVGLDRGAEAGHHGLLGVVGGTVGGAAGLLIGTVANLGDAAAKVPLIGDVFGGVFHLGANLLKGAADAGVSLVDGILSMGDGFDLGFISKLLNGESGGLASGLGEGLQLGVKYGADVADIGGVAGAVSGTIYGFIGFGEGTLENLGFGGTGGDVHSMHTDYLL